MNHRRHKTIRLTMRLAVVSLLLGGLALAGCSTISNSLSAIRKPFISLSKSLSSQADAEGNEAEPGPKIDYEVELDIAGPGKENKRLDQLLRDSSTTLRLQDRPTATLTGLQRRAEEDVERFTGVLRSLSYYDGRVEYAIRPKDGGEGTGEPAEAAPAPGSPAVVHFSIDSGPPYLLDTVKLQVVRPDRTVHRAMNEQELKLTRLTPGEPAEAEAIIQGEQHAVEIIRAGGYPLAKAGDRKVTADTMAKTLTVTYNIATGRRATFGPVTVRGATTVDPGFIAGYRTWKEGQLYTPEEIDKTRRELAASNLFLAASVKPAEEINEQGEIPIEIEVTERKHRTIGGGIDYSTADGFGGNALWEHRNLFGAGERLRLHLTASQLQYGFEAEFSKPQFLQQRQALVADSQSKEFTTEAYKGEVTDGFIGLERKFAEIWAATLGVTAEYSDLTGPASPNEYFFLGGLRGKLRRDSTKNPLDPVSGSRLDLTILPQASLTGGNTHFVSLLFNGSKYLPLDEAGHYVLAGRASAGSILGDDLSALPANQRFYAGGGGSIRGYAYQNVGPLDQNDKPIGGRSLLETGLEFRTRITESIGLVPFIEGGNVYENSSPDNLDLRWAAGLGLRYYTPVGPLRFDIAVPLDRRSIDDPFQLYISIGQAF